MGVQVSIDLPESVFSALKTSPESFVSEMRLAAAIKWFEAGIISQSKGAEIAGVSRQAFIDAMARFSVSVFQDTPEQLAEELTRD
jgi:predicted HTH domain antitoxin